MKKQAEPFLTKVLDKFPGKKTFGLYRYNFLNERNNFNMNILPHN